MHGGYATAKGPRLAFATEINDLGANSMAQEIKVVFMPSGKRGNFPEGTTVLDAARTLGVDLDTVCGGRAVCVNGFFAH